LEKNILRSEGCFQEVEITLTKEELQPYYDAAYKAAQPTIKLQGFRPGKVPMNMIKKQFGKRIEADENFNIINKEFSKMAQEENLYILGKPDLVDFTEENGKLTFKIRYETMPEYEIEGYKNLSIEEPVHSVTDEEVERQIQQILFETAQLDDAEEIVDDLHSVEIDFYNIDEDTDEVMEGKPFQSRFVIKQQLEYPNLNEALIGKKAGDKFRINLETEDGNQDVEAVVNVIKKVTPSELTTEFIENYTGGKFSTEQDFRDELSFRMQETWEKRSLEAMHGQIRDHLVKMNANFPIPDSLVVDLMNSMLKQMKQNNQGVKEVQSLTIDDVEFELRPDAEKLVRWDLIRAKIAEKEEIKVEEYDIEAFVEQNFPQAQTEEQKAQAIKIVKDNYYVMDNLLGKKVNEFILDFCTTVEVPFNHGDHHHAAGQEHDHEHDPDFNPQYEIEDAGDDEENTEDK